VCSLGVDVPAASADETLKRIFADWKTIREAEDVYRFEYSYARQNFTSKVKFPDISGDFVIDWPTQMYRKQQWSKSFRDGKPIMGIEVFDGTMRSVLTWPVQTDGTVGKSPVKATTSKGDFTATQFSQDLFPFMLSKRVVISRPRETYRPGKMRFDPDEVLFYVHRREGPLVTINTYPTSAGPSRSYWQYDVELGKQSVIRAMRSMQQSDGKPDVVFIEWLIEYRADGPDWVIAGWVERQFDVVSGKLLNRHDMKVSRFEKSLKGPKFSHDIPDGQKVQSITYPEYNPSANVHRIVETTEYRDSERSRTRRHLAIAAAILGVLVLAHLVARRLRKPRNP
jgi:hypothetical protein